VLADYGTKNRGMLTYLGENGTAVKAQLLQRWTQRMSVAINRSTMEELWFRVEIRRTGPGGDDALTGVDIRFGGVSGLPTLYLDQMPPLLQTREYSVMQSSKYSSFVRGLYMGHYFLIVPWLHV